MDNKNISSSTEEINLVIKIPEVSKDHVQLMHQKISEPPRILSHDAGKPSCSIFRVPQSLIEVNGKIYQPHIVSIGPYHRGESQLRMIEEHKWQYLGSLLARTEKNRGIKLEDYLSAMAELEQKARECYSETIHLSTEEFAEMMVLDGCFIIELLRKAANLVLFEKDDPILSMAWIIPFFYRDFLRLENQIPFFVLEKLFEISESKPQEQPALTLLALQFFDNAIQRPEGAIEKNRDLKPRHLLDLIRLSLIPTNHPEPRVRRKTPAHIIHCVSKLRRAGINLRATKDDTFLCVKFERGVIEMPPITIDDFTTSFLVNCVSFEQCHKSCTKHFTTYATLLDCLVNTSRDVEFLCDRNIMENCYGNDSDVARFINNMGKDVAFDIDMCYLGDLFDDVHQYYRNSWHVQWAGFKYTYFDTPWSFISAFAALVLLLLTVAQTVYTVYSFYKP
ncbi:hypothetical protein F8388_021807 [Cannabis sativa]|uniref:Uncharacterized protein n=1 Tax=Cannabis sativa TaxID=3483 RepID=A0A7J6GMA7_CANSA|nr:hypothetical protein F8388_021807 [Cannabis sativa]KAF4384056.1 hypothetical protein G4B88_030952 [Cannabis sativa]